MIDQLSTNTLFTIFKINKNCINPNSLPLSHWRQKTRKDLTTNQLSLFQGNNWIWDYLTILCGC